MVASGSPTPVVAEPVAVLGTVAGLLADGCDLSVALEALVAGLGLGGVAVRSAAGDLLGTAGDVLRDAASPLLEVPVPHQGGLPGTLTVHGARPSHLAALRAVASTLSLALAPTPDAELLDAALDEWDGLADSLHDGPVQALVVARLAADLAVRGGDPVVARDAVQEALVALRRSLWQIRPRGAHGLVDALHQLSEQRAEAGLEPLDVAAQPGADLSGTAGALAYRVAQVAGGRVLVRLDGDAVVVEVRDGALLHPELWVARARALGGDLYASAGRIRLVLPLTTSARTAP